MTSEDSQNLIKEVRKTAENLREHLNRLSKKRYRLPGFSPDPVQTKNLEKIAGYLQNILVYFDVHNSEALPPGQRAESLRSLLEQLKTPSALSANNSWELADLLDTELLWFSDDADLYIRLKAQQGSANDDAANRNNYFPGDYLQILINHYQEGKFADAHRLEVIHFLEYFKQAQISEYRRDRAKVQLRGSYLAWMAVMLGLMLLGLGSFYVASRRDETRDLWQLLLMAFAGATGSVLSRAVKLGKQPLHISDAKGTREPPLGIRALLSDWKVFLAQPVIGAATALVIFLAISSGLLQIGGMKEFHPAGYALIGFLSGFSEPFFIGTLDKITGGSGNAVS
jgi:hypothetical protein